MWQQTAAAAGPRQPLKVSSGRRPGRARARTALRPRETARRGGAAARATALPLTLGLGMMPLF
jgi:hypothetical protein